ncbi:MAG: FliA/WhiG family RNA polymerase sigma factor [Phycisphaerae bacterium]|nr:FliA/WhiG family RNA polymerase sigma factor [Phycisphaerae bacterium]
MPEHEQKIEQLIPPDKEMPTQEGRYAEQFSEKGYLAGQAVKAYHSQMSRQKRDALVLQYIPLVHRIVSQVVSYLQPPLSKEDLISAGTIGLIKAAMNFDAAKDAEFKTYAYIRVRGAVIDELRGWSFAPPHVEKLLSQARTLSEQMFKKHGIFPTDRELADEMGIEQEKLFQVFETARAGHFLSLNGMDSDGSNFDQFLVVDSKRPDAGIERQELKSHLAEAIGSLPEKERRIILLYYHEELTMREIAEALELTEARISQLHAASLFKLSVQLKLWSEKE